MFARSWAGLDGVRRGSGVVQPMTFRIYREVSGTNVSLRLLGHLRVEHLEELRTQLEAKGSDIVADVSGLTLISVEGIRFLNSCEDRGIAITNASQYISEWMTLERTIGSKGA